METEPDKEVVLHYIDKVHNGLTETVQILNRIGILLALLSIFTIALSAGLVSANQNYSFEGLNFVISYWIIIMSGAWATGILSIYYMSLDNHRTMLRDEIIQLYRSIGYENTSMKDGGTGALEVPNMMILLIEVQLFREFKTVKFIDRVITLSIFGFISLIPIVTEIFAFYKFTILLGLVWWGLASFIILFLLTMSYFIAMLRN